MIAVWLLTLWAMIVVEPTSTPAPAPLLSTSNRWAEPTRGILAQHCGRCHIPNLPTSVPRALAVFDLTEEPWYGRMTHQQLDDLLHRLHSIKTLPDKDGAIVESFVLCARDQVCPSSDR